MASFIMRGIDDRVNQQLVSRVKERGRSMEAEVRDILTHVARWPHICMAFLGVARDVGEIDGLADSDARQCRKGGA
ncbi:toxin-antitoxin system [Brevibacterium sp. HMSC24B04]|uniref:FitA-like ribbon-helix-helix domain-containing protein n=1 Tax=Brevibacterium sp. HMSC24B04 TaxID=1581060 RepID=UPI0008A64F8C|nr:toxin-antitoxin system [Brevibacterium sp. HMSC24B04]